MPWMSTTGRGGGNPFTCISCAAATVPSPIPATFPVLTLLLTCPPIREAGAANARYSASRDAQEHKDLKKECTAPGDLYGSAGGADWTDKKAKTRC